MTPLTRAELERLFDLTADEALGGLDASDRAELEALRARAGADAPSYDDLLGGLVLATDDPREGAMPAATAMRLKAAGRTMVARDGPPMPKRGGAAVALAWSGWLAAAAGFVLAAALWQARPTGRPATPASPVREPTLEERATALVNEPDTVVTPFSAAGLIEGRENAGDIVWNGRLQRGFLRVGALDENDPAQGQYQLWIFDKSRETYPVDGGVFDVAAAQPRDAQGRTIIPFEPALRVGDPAAFAVTVERPGGVVVTDRTGLVLFGPVGGE